MATSEQDLKQDISSCKTDVSKEQGKEVKENIVFMSSLPKLTTEGILIRKAEKSDMKAVCELIKEYASLENMSKGPKLSVEDLERDGFEVHPSPFKCVVAEQLLKNGPKVVGYALYYPTYSPWEGRSLMLEDLYVSSSMRKQGIGRKLFHAIAKDAKKANCNRLDFHASDWKKSHTFYESLGAKNIAETDRRNYYRLSGEALSSFLDAYTF